MITLQCQLSFDSEKDKKQVLDLMRHWSACMRYAYQRLLEGTGRNELRRDLPGLFRLNSRYVDDAILKAKETISSTKELGHSPRKVIFGGRKLFEQLKKKHLNGKDRQRLRLRWREVRQGHLYSRGDTSKKGNLNLRFIQSGETLYLRINVGKREYVLGTVHRNVQPRCSLRDKWTGFIHNLIQAELSGKWFPYSVELKLMDGNIYALVSFKERLPQVEITRDHGIIGIDINAGPFHLAWTEVQGDGNLVDSDRIDLSYLLSIPADKKDLLIWEVAYQVINLAREKGRVIALESLKGIPRGHRGDGIPKLRKRFHHFVYQKLLERIEVLAQRNGIEVIKIPPAWSSVVGALKYAPQYGLDKDQAAAFVIARRGLGFWDKIPRNYRKLLSDKEFLEYSLFRWQQRRKTHNDELNREGNRWKRNRIHKVINQATKEIKLLQKRLKSLVTSSKSDSAFPKEAAQGKKSPSDRAYALHKCWRVLRAAVVVPLLGKPFVRDYSPLKQVLVSGVGMRATVPLVPIRLPNMVLSALCWSPQTRPYGLPM